MHEFDPATGAGMLLTDSGVLVPLAREVFLASLFRHLRLGQRVQVTPDPRTGAPMAIGLMGR